MLEIKKLLLPLLKQRAGVPEKKVITTTITEEVGDEPMYRTKSYGISQFDNPKDDFDK